MQQKHEMIVTSLEMTSEPGPQALTPPKGQIAILKAKHIPAHFYHYLHDSVTSGKTLIAHTSETQKGTPSDLTSNTKDIYVLYIDGVPGGFVEVDWHADNAAELSYLGIIPDYTGQGYGRYLLHHIIHLIWNQAPSRITIETSDENHPRALPLLQRMGFEVIKQDVRERKMPRLTAANMDDPT